MCTGIELSMFLSGTVSVMKTSLPARFALIISTPAGMRMIGARGGPFLPHAAARKATPSTASHDTREDFNRAILLFGCCRHVRISLGRRHRALTAADVGRTEPADVDAEVSHLVVEDPLGGIEEACRLRAIPARRLERILDEVALETIDRVLQRD